ncbi:MAG: hypothetical protein KM296_00600 [Brockia lithotrophica]|nr:hypothetical protein [Brockia lithotrophica]
MGQPSIHLSFDRPTGNFWVDTGLVVLLGQFGEGEHPVERVREWLVGQLVQPSGNKGKYYDQNSGQFREYDKVNWVYPTNIFIKVSGSAPKTEIEIEGKKEKVLTSPPTFDLSFKFSKRPGACDLCGDQALLTEAKMWMYPFVVDPDKFGTFYSGAKRPLRLCARCALAGMAGYVGWLWKAQGNEALHFFIFHSELREMKRLQEEVLAPLRLEGDRGGTAPVAFAGPYTHETVWGLILKLFTYVGDSDEDELSEEARDLLASHLGATGAELPPAPITLYAVTGKPGQAFSMRALRGFSKLQQLYRLYESWIKIITEENIDIRPHQRVTRIFEQFWAQQGQNRETIWRDKIAHAILEFSDPSPFVEQFLFEARAKEKTPRPLLRGTLEVLRKYLKEVFGMDEQFQRILAGFGYSLGEAAQAHKEMGLLYALRNAKNPEDFYRVLNDIQFRLEMTVPEALLRIEKGERIAGVPWIRVKTLLSIYAMNAYLRKATPQSGAQTKEEE